MTLCRSGIVVPPPTDTEMAVDEAIVLKHEAEKEKNPKAALMAADKKTTEAAEGIIQRPLTLGVYNVKINVQGFGMCACVERGWGSQLDVAIPKEDKQT